MKPIIAIDLDGALMYSRPFKEAHKRWFNIMSVLLNDSSVKKYADLEDYFPKVNEVMERYLGKVDEETRTRFARELFAMVTIAEVKKSDLVENFVRYLRGIKKKYRLTLITSAPEPTVEPILEKVGCSDLFDILYKSPVGKRPDKRELFKQFIEQYQKPVFYIGNGDKDIKSCKELGIPSISVSWVSKGKEKGDYDIKSVKELESILK